MNSVSRAKLIIIREMKNIGVERDLRISLRGVLTMKQEQTRGSFSIDFSSC